MSVDQGRRLKTEGMPAATPRSQSEGDGSSADRVAKQRNLKNQQATVARGREIFDVVHPRRSAS